MNDADEEKTKAEPYAPIANSAREAWDRLDRHYSGMTDDDAYDDYRERTR